jgi:hypothetical protein
VCLFCKGYEDIDDEDSDDEDIDDEDGDDEDGDDEDGDDEDGDDEDGDDEDGDDEDSEMIRIVVLWIVQSFCYYHIPFVRSYILVSILLN